MNKEDFQALIWEKGRELYRPMPWRENTDPYWILVSELMLQQTQVHRVIPKFEAFIGRFPTIRHLAQASLSDVLVQWSGLGYNRRAKFLHAAAQVIVSDYSSRIPSDPAALQTLPGVGANTAGAIATYGFNKVAPFVETNVRSVYFHDYFDDEDAISDRHVLEAVAETIDTEHPREWYWALMDYGSWLKRNGLGANSRSAHYTRQSPLRGSLREVRGLILAYLTAHGSTPFELLRTELPQDDRFERAVSDLIQEGLLRNEQGMLKLP